MSNSDLFSRFARFAVLARGEAKNHADELKALLYQGFVRKAYRGKQVFYMLTAKAVPLLEDYRQVLLASAHLQARLHGRSRFYQSLLGDLRFLDDKQPEAQDYLLLGDWQLQRPVTEVQLELAKERYWEKQ